MITLLAGDKTLAPISSAPYTLKSGHLVVTVNNPNINSSLHWYYDLWEKMTSPNIPTVHKGLCED